MISNIENYLTTEEVLNALGIDFLTYSTATRALKLLEIPYEKISDGRSVKLYYLKTDIQELILKVKAFFKEFGVIDEFNVSPKQARDNSITTLPMPKGYNPLFFKDRLKNMDYKAYKVVYSRKEIYELEAKLNKLNECLSEESCIDALTGVNKDYILLKDALNILDYNDRVFKKIRSDYNIREIKVSRSILLNLKDIQVILDKRNEFYKEYIDGKSISEKYLNGKDNYSVLKKLKVYEAPIYARTISKSSSIGNSGGVYKISEVEELFKYRINHDINCDTPFETFLARLESVPSWTGFSNESDYTSTMWFKYLKIILNKTISKGSVLSGIISKYIKATIFLKEMVFRFDKKEVSQLSSSEINFYLKGLDLVTQKDILYNFLKYIHQDALMNNKSLSFKIQFIKKPESSHNNEENDSSTEDVIYDFELYSKVFQYQTNIEMHVEMALSEINNQDSCVYASTWLYVMLHLNNAWRHGDVRDFPVLDIDDLIDQFGITELDWFNKNSLTLEQSRGVISRIIQWEFIISKTQMKGNFFCSDDLAPSLSTAIIILTLYNKRLLSKKGTLMEFNTKYNDITESILKKFFKNLGEDDFVFSSRKFNKSVMTYITFLSNLSGDKKALKYAQYMRAHNNISSTLSYLDFNIEAVESLASMLFARGEFGYVTSLLLNKLNEGEVKNFEEATEQIYMINKVFGDASTISATVGFLNTIRADRASVTSYLSEMSFEQCQELLTDLFARKLPSKCGTDIQCLFSKKGCQRIDLNAEDYGCFECPYHIPTIYALNTLCESMISDLKKYNLETRVPNKFRLQLRIHRKKLSLSEAVHKFGSEYVFSCLGIAREDFIELISDIPNPMEID